MKLGPILIVASALTFAGAAHAEGTPGSPNSVMLFWEQQAATAPTKTPALVRAIEAPAKDRQIVRASWYGGGERLSPRTSTGEIFRPMALTAAHRTLPLGTILRVSSLSTGLTTVVRVNDRGPAASTGRALDLSRGAAAQIGLLRSGDMRVAIQVVQ